MKKKTIVECKSCGVPLIEEVARQVDALVKTLPRDCTYRHKGTVPENTELISGERADISTISTEHVDRDGEVILAKGMNTEMFALNPVVTLSHKYDELPVGKAAWIKKFNGGMRAKTVYSEATPIAQACWDMTKEGILKGKSIGFMPTMIRAFTKDEIDRNPHWKNASACIESGILLEYAVCAIPVNQACLIEAVAKGTIDKKMLNRLGYKMTPPKKLTEEQIAKIIEREFKKGIAMLSPQKLKEAMLDKYRI